MKRLICFLCALIAFLSCSTAVAEDYYYESIGEKVQLFPIEGKVVIREVPKEGCSATTEIPSIYTKVGDIKDSQNNLGVYSTPSDEFVSFLETDNAYLHIERAYRDDSGVELYPTQYIYVRSKSSSAPPYNQEVLQIFDQLDLEYQMLYFPYFIQHGSAIYLLRPKGKNKNSSITICQELMSTGKFYFCEPDFAYNPFCGISLDLHIDEQWALYNKDCPGIDLGAAGAWSQYTGYGTTIALIDEGVDTNHKELKSNVSKQIYIGSGNNDLEYYGPHGTMCAGVIAAQYNKGNIAGIAPDAKIISLKVDCNMSACAIGNLCLALLEAKKHASIISCSWLPYKSELFASTIETEFSEDENSEDLCVMPVMQYSSYSKRLSNRTIMVGAIDKYGNAVDERTWSSNTFITAPGKDILTLSPGNGVTVASGTSMSVAYVAGTLAMMKEKWADLSRSMAMKTLAASAKKIGGEEYLDCKIYRYDYTRNDKYGVGLLNASGALKSMVGCYIYKECGE